MTPSIIVELAGLIASVLVLISYLFQNQVQLRAVNLIASFVFTGYSIGLIVTTSGVNGWSTLVLNLACAAVHIFWLFKYFKAKKAPPTNPSKEDKN